MVASLKVKKLYNCITSQVISESGKFLFAGNRFGDIFVLDVEELDSTNDKKIKVNRYPQEDGVEINSISFHRNFLIVGTIGCIYSLKWNEDERRLSTRRKWIIRIPMKADATEVPDINYLWLRPNTDTLFAGCGDNVIYQISLEDGRIERNYCGHDDFIHAVTGCGSNTVLSASEDGTVRLWNENEKNATAKLTPSENSELKRPQFGNWIGAVDANNDWIACGGGPKCAIYHLRSLNSTGSYSFPGKVHLCSFIDDKIIIGGEHDYVYVCNWSGETEASIAVEHTTTFNAVWQTQPVKFMSVGGFSNKLHILKDFLLDSKVDLYGNIEGDLNQKDNRFEFT